MAGGYWQRVGYRAWGDTLNALSLDSPMRVVAKSLVAAIGIALFWFLLGGAEFESKLHSAGIAAVAAGIVFSILFLINLILVPRKLDAELRENLKQRATKEERQAAIDDLAEEIDWATQNLVNPNPHPLASTSAAGVAEKWRDDCEAWYKRVSAKLANKKFFTRAQQLHFDTLTNVDQILTGNSNTRFKHKYNILCTKIRRLREIIDQLSRV